MASRPGVMIYFEDIKPFTECYTDEQCGMLLRAIISYAENGEWIVDDDSDIKIALKVLKPKIDRDAESYEKKKLHAQYMTYVREAKDAGRDYLSEQEWTSLTAAQRQHSNR